LVSSWRLARPPATRADATDGREDRPRHGAGQGDRHGPPGAGGPERRPGREGPQEVGVGRPGHAARIWCLARENAHGAQPWEGISGQNCARGRNGDLSGWMASEEQVAPALAGIQRPTVPRTGFGNATCAVPTAARGTRESWNIPDGVRVCRYRSHDSGYLLAAGWRNRCEVPSRADRARK